jgi:hypothetical protein
MNLDWQNEIRKRLSGLSLEPTRESAIVEELAQDLDDRYAALLAGGASAPKPIKKRWRIEWQRITGA